MENPSAPNLVEVLNTIVALLAIGISFFSLWLSRKALNLSNTQEERQRPCLRLYLRDSYFQDHIDSNSRYFAFLLSVDNRSDADNAISETHLRLTYTINDGFETTVKIPPDKNAEKVVGKGTEPVLSTPQGINAHQTVDAWCYFQVKDALLGNGRIEGHSVVITDSHGIETLIESIFIKEFEEER